MISILILREGDDVQVTARLYPVDKNSPHYGRTIAAARFTQHDRTASRLALRRALSSLLAELED